MSVVVTALLLEACAAAAQTRDPDTARESTGQIEQLEESGRFRDAIPLAERALTIDEKFLGTDHPETIALRGRLAVLYLSSADPVTADVVAKVEALLQRNFTILQKQFGPRGGETRGLLTGRAFLLPGQSEPQGYGLYSYLLFDAPPRNQEERALHLKALEAYVLLLPLMSELERHKRQSQLNVTFVPVTNEVAMPDDLTTPEQATRLAEQLLARYDYVQARVVLDSVGKETRRSGPYFVSRIPGESTARLFVDMSHVVPDLAWDWTRAYCWLAAQERSWSDVTLQKLELNTRNAFALAASRFFDIVTLPQSIRLVNPAR
jgi:hypothetical protein